MPKLIPITFRLLSQPTKSLTKLKKRRKKAEKETKDGKKRLANNARFK